MSDFDDRVEDLLATGQGEDVLRPMFGVALYQDLSELARRARQARDADTQEAARRQVFILPGIMGSKLSQSGPILDDYIWIDVDDLIAGGVSKLKLQGQPGKRVVFASGVVLAAYLHCKLRLTIAGYDARFLPFDWRLSESAPVGRNF